MLNVLKKVEGLRHGGGGAKVNGLEPPANLPDLARDMYEREQLVATRADSASSVRTDAQKVTEQKSVEPNDSRNMPADSKFLVEPNKESVPRLDLSLVKQHIAASEAAIQSVHPVQYSSDQYSTQSLHTQRLPIDTSMYKPENKSFVQESGSQNVSQPIHDTIFNNIGMNTVMVDDGTGFFKEFEEHVKNNGLDNDIVNDLLNRNWLDHMLFYHTMKGEDTPFYASSAELSHAIKLKLENLQNFERNWVMNKQKIDLLKKLGSTLETDIHVMSEELKKLMIESKKRDLAGKSVDLKSSGFFQLIKPKTTDQVFENQVTNTSNTDAANVSSQMMQHHSTVPIQFTHATSLMQQNPSLLKYPLNKYVVHDSSKYFYAQNGNVYKSLRELMDGLESMDVDTFNHHVNETKNDFSSWIKGVFGDYRLSDALRSLNDRERLWYFLKNNTV